MGRLLTCLLWSLGAACAALLAWGAFVIADSSFRPSFAGQGVVENRAYNPSWIQTIVHTSGNSTWTQVIVHPESWSVRVRSGDGSDSLSVSQSMFDRCPTGTPVKIRFCRGRFSGGFYVTDIEI